MKNFKVGDWVVVVEVPTEKAARIGSIGTVQKYGGLGVPEETEYVALRIYSYNDGAELDMVYHESWLRPFDHWYEGTEDVTADIALSMMKAHLALMNQIDFKVNDELLYAKTKKYSEQQLHGLVDSLYRNDDNVRSVIEVMVKMVEEKEPRTTIAPYWNGAVLGLMARLNA